MSPLIAKYTDGITHAHLGGTPHFHEIRKGATDTGIVTDTQGVELGTQHGHPVVGGVIKVVPVEDEKKDEPGERTPMLTTSVANAQQSWVGPTAKRGIRGLLELLKQGPSIDMTVNYHVIQKSAPEQRFTLGIVYRPGSSADTDAHGDYMTADEIEKAAWKFAQRGYLAQPGLQHKSGTQGRGRVVESSVYRGPDWTIGDQVVKAGTWLMGCVWDEPTWQDIKSGKYAGWSLQGYGERSADVPSAGIV